MIHKIDNLRQLPYNLYSGYVLKNESDKDAIVGNKIGYLYISKSPVCIFLFVEGVKEIDGK